MVMPRFRLATLFTFAFGVAVGLMFENYFDAIGSAPVAPTQVVYLSGAVSNGAIELPIERPLSITEAISIHRVLQMLVNGSSSSCASPRERGSAFHNSKRSPSHRQPTATKPNATKF